MPDSPCRLDLAIPRHLAGQRLDRALGELVPDLSRARLQKMVRRGQVWLRGRLVTRSNVPVAAGDAVQVVLHGPREAAAAGPSLPLLHVDDHMLVVDKPAGTMSHATERHPRGSVAEQLARSHGPLPVGMGEDRPGIVHRLDRETSGLMVLARTDAAMEHLRAQFRERAVQKTYLALVHGAPSEPRGTVELPLAPAPGEPDRQRVAPSGERREAHTEWELAERLGPVSLLRCRPTTGRRHQIRVHLLAIGLPLVGDRLYRGREGEPLPSHAPPLARQALHAHRLGFRHPRTDEPVAFESPLPRDLAELSAALREA